MTQPVSVRRRVVLLTALAGLLLLPARLPADPVPGQQDRLVIQLASHFLQQAHLARPEINDSLSRRLFQRFFKTLDPAKLYFLKSDVEEFRKQEAELDDQLLRGDVSFAYKVYGRYLDRLSERLKLVDELVNAAHDFTVKEYMNTDTDKLDWAGTENELRERWRTRIKYDLLLNRLDKKPLPEAESKQRIQTRYQSALKRAKQADNYDLLELYLSDLTASVDPHSSYMSPNTLDDFDISMRLQLEGIGALLRSENGQTILSEIVPGGAAAADGRLKANDKIVAVAQGDSKFTDILDMKLREVVKLIRGPKGTKVQLRVIPAEKSEPVIIELTRQTIQLKDQEARSEILEHGKKPDGTPFRIGVIDLPSFYADITGRGRPGSRSATEDVRKLLTDFKAKGVDGVVLDLRHNGGGSLNEALALTGLFLDKGPLLQVKGFQGRVQRHDDPEAGMVYAGPLLVLVSHLSASASEILAGAMQDYGRALVVGDAATHGKGTVQTVVELGGQLQGGNNPPKLGALKLTIQQFYRVTGDSTQNRGVLPDVLVPSVLAHLGTGEKELEHALPFDRVKSVEHAQLSMVPAELKTLLQARSAERVKNSKEFAKLLKDIEMLQTRRAKKAVPLNEEELKAQFTKEDAEKADPQSGGLLLPEKKQDGAAYKFARNFQNTEMLQIMEDFLQGKKLTMR